MLNNGIYLGGLSFFNFTWITELSAVRTRGSYWGNQVAYSFGLITGTSPWRSRSLIRVVGERKSSGSERRPIDLAPASREDHVVDVRLPLPSIMPLVQALVTALFPKKREVTNLFSRNRGNVMRMRYQTLDTPIDIYFKSAEGSTAKQRG